jgi:hypothetical protein
MQQRLARIDHKDEEYGNEEGWNKEAHYTENQPSPRQKVFFYDVNMRHMTWKKLNPMKRRNS